MKIPIYQVDAFTDKLFGGNPAAVCPLEEWLPGAMMQAIAEGFALLRGKQEFNLDLAQIGELWKHGSVVRSWLLDLTADALKADQTLENIKPIVPDSGEGRWTAIEAIDQGQALPVISMSLAMRFASQDQVGYSNRLLSMMRNAFGGHAVAKK